MWVVIAESKVAHYIAIGTQDTYTPIVVQLLNYIFLSRVFDGTSRLVLSRLSLSVKFELMWTLLQRLKV